MSYFELLIIFMAILVILDLSIYTESFKMSGRSPMFQVIFSC